MNYSRYLDTLLWTQEKDEIDKTKGATSSDQTVKGDSKEKLEGNYLFFDCTKMRRAGKRKRPPETWRIFVMDKLREYQTFSSVSELDDFVSKASGSL